MKRGLLFLAIAALSCVWTLAHHPGRDAVTVELGSGKVTIDYGTPKLGDRNLEEMIKPGTPWRIGMNNATTLETTLPLEFGGKKLTPGKYTIFAKTDESKNWVLIVTTGTATRIDPATVVFETPLQFKQEDPSVDVLKITLDKAGDGAAIRVAWGTYRLAANFKAAA